MKDYLKLYQEYYRLRMLRYEGNHDYTNSCNCEKEIYEAIKSCQSLDEFKTKLGNLNGKNAVALVIDQYTIRYRFYAEMGETAKAGCCKRITEKAKTISNVTDLMTMVNEEEHQLMLSLTADTIHPFEDFVNLENMEIWQDAEVPEKYKSQYKELAEKEKESIKEKFQRQKEAVRNMVPGWNFSLELINEFRHRRLLPYSDETVLRNKLLTEQILK